MKKFKILSLDGGGIRGIFPARFLSNIVDHLKISEGRDINIYDYFDLITGTSTGGILALSFGLGISPKCLFDLYYSNAHKIFGNKRCLLFNSMYSTKNIKELLKAEFAKVNDDNIIRLGHSKTRLCIPSYNSKEGKVVVYKTAHHKELIRDYQIPAYQIALATSAAPLYFNPYSDYYIDLTDKSININSNIDGGVYSNNPSLIAFTEAIETLNVSIEDISFLSIGTGSQKFKDNKVRKRYGLLYWINHKRKRLIELIMHSQADNVQNLMKFLNEGVGNSYLTKFKYDRIDFEFDSEDEYVSLDETKKSKLDFLIEKADHQFKIHGTNIINEYFSEKVEKFKPVYSVNKEQSNGNL